MKIFKISLLILLIICLNIQPLFAYVSLKGPANGRMSIGYSKRINSAYINKLKYNYYSRRRNKWILFWATRRSFSTRVRYDIRPTYPSKEISVSYNRTSGVLSVAKFPYQSPHGNQFTEYNVNTGAVTIYGAYQSTKTIYYRNGYAETYYAPDKPPTYEYVGIATYYEQRKLIEGIIDEAIAGLKDKGKVIEGKRQDLAKAKIIITNGQ